MHRKYFFAFLVISNIGCDTAFERSLVDQQPKLVAPANNYLSTERSNLFYWNYLPGAVSYEVQIVTPRFDLVEKVIIDTVSEYNSIRLHLDSGAYQWRVRALNYSTASKFSDTFGLTIK